MRPRRAHAHPGVLSAARIAACCLLGAILCPGQQVAGTAADEQVQQRLAALEKRVAELEKMAACSNSPVTLAAAAPDPAPSAPAQAAPPAGAPAKPAPAAMADARDTFGPTLNLHGFADLNFSAGNRPGSHSGFTFGEFVLHFSSKLSSKISAFAEVALEAETQGWSIDLERALVRYDINDAAKVSFGRYHTPLNYWNTAYHHGFWLQTTISRPRMVDFDGPYLPAHFVGLQVEGSLPSGGLGLGYNVGLGNGRGVNLPDPSHAGNVGNKRAWVLNLYSRPARVKGLQFGASVYHDRVFPGVPTGRPAEDAGLLGLMTPEPSPLISGPSFPELIASAHAVWITNGPELLAEFANIRHSLPDGSASFNSPAYYFQAAYRLPDAAKRFKPYYRYEYIRSPIQDPVLKFVSREVNFRLHTLGVRYDISDFAAFKLEYRHEFDPLNINSIGPRRIDAVFAQTAFTF